MKKESLIRTPFIVIFVFLRKGDYHFLLFIQRKVKFMQGIIHTINIPVLYASGMFITNYNNCKRWRLDKSKFKT